MSKPLTPSQIIDIQATEPSAVRMSGGEFARIVRRIEWEHKIGDDQDGFSNQGMLRRKDEEFQRKMLERPVNQRKWNDEKLSELLAAKKAGESPSSMAARLGITRQRVHELIRKAKRDANGKGKSDECPFDGLSARARNALIASVEERTLDAAYKLVASKKKVQGIGAGSRFEIERFLIGKGYKLPVG